ncbi:MAG: ComEA family DNA-binding protein [Chitinophagaceae bacterium]
MKQWSVVMLCCLLCFHALAQETGVELEQLLEEAAMNSGEEAVEFDWQEQVQELERRGINLNRADRAEMAAIPWLSDWHISRLLTYRSLFGPILSIYELQAVPGWDVALIRKLKPFLRWGHEGELPWKQRWTNGERRLSMAVNRVLQRSRGFLSEGGNDPVYAGAPEKWQLRYRYQYRRSLQWGITLEKDAGEMFVARRKLNGFMSAHLQLTNWKGITQLNLGDFSVNMGQGLIQWQGMGAGPGGNATAIFKQAQVVKAHTSAGELQFYRGAAIIYKLGNISFTGYTGLRRLGAAIDSTGVGATEASALNLAGTYRTAAEMDRKGKLGLWAMGGAAQWEQHKLKLALNWAGFHWEHQLKNGTEPYQLLRKNRRQQHAVSMYASYVGKAAYLFGEYALDARKKPAFTGGLLTTPHRSIEMAVSLRAISSGYNVWNGSVFGASSRPSNEFGVYGGLKYLSPFSIVLDVWGEVCYYPWLKYRASAPGTGTAFRIQFTGKPDRNTEWRAAYRFAAALQNNGSVDMLIETPEERNTGGAKLYWSVILDREWQYRMRFEYINRKDSNSRTETGSLWLAEARWSPAGKKYHIDGRLQYFQTGSYNTRLYALEKDIPFQQGVPAFYGKGWRYYLMVTYKFRKSFQCWFRIGHTGKPDVAETGSGYNTISGGARTELSFQWQILF